MPFGSIKVKPGVNIEMTPTLNEAGISDSNLIRFREGMVEKLGGWVKYFGTAISSIVRALHAWEDLNANLYLGVGAESNLVYLVSGNPAIGGSFTGTANIFSYGSLNSTFSGSITGTTLTISAMTTGSVGPGTSITDNVIPTNITANTYIVSQLSGTTGGAGTYTVSQTYVSPVTETMYGSSSGVLNVQTVTSGVVAVGQSVSGTNIQGDTYITAFLSGTGGIGWYALNGQQTVATTSITCVPAPSSSDITPKIDPTDTTLTCDTTIGSDIVTLHESGRFVGTGTVSGTILTITGVTSGALTVEMPITSTTTLPVGTYISSFGTGDGGLGTYNLNASFSPSGSETITGTVFITVYDSVYIRTPISVGGLVLFGIYQCLSNGNGSTSIQASANATSTVTGGGVLPYFTTTVNSPSINVYFPNHGLQTGSRQAFLVNTVVDSISIYGEYPVTYVNADNYTIQGANKAGTGGVSAYMNGNLADLIYYVGYGPPTLGGGYGIGPYGIGPYGIGASATAHVSSDINTSDWFLSNFGQILVGTPYNSPVYLWNPESGIQNATVIPQAPAVNAGLFISMPVRQIVTWGSTFTGIQDPLLLRWCDVEDYASWTASSTNQAGSFRIPTGSRIVGCIQAAQQALIFTDIDLYSMQYIQPPLVYGFTKISSGCGLIAPKAVTQSGPDVYWMSQKQFFVASAQGVMAIDCPVWDYIYQNLDTANVNKIRAATNSAFNEIWWFFPALSAGTGDVSNYVKYNTAEKVWDYGSLARTAWIDQSVLGTPIGAGTNNYIYQHEIGQSADGQTMPSYFQTGYTALQNGQDFTFVDYMIPDMKWGYYNSSEAAQVDYTIDVTNYPNGTVTTYGPYSATANTEILNGVRFRGRQVSIKIGDDAPGNPGVTFWRVGNIRFRGAPDGRR